MLGYVATVLAMDQSDPQIIHDQTYEHVRGNVPAETYNQFVDGQADPFRAAMAVDAGGFVQLIPYYKIRPLYNLLVYLLHKMGLSIVQATMVVSAASYAILGTLIFAWIRHHAGGALGLILALLLALSHPLLEVGRLSTPDALSAALLVAGLYLLIERQRTTAFALLALLSIGIRTDNVVYVGLLLIGLQLRPPSGARIGMARTLAWLAAALGSYLMINHWAGHYGWATVFQHTFIEKITNPAGTQVSVSFLDYALSVVKQGLASMRDSGLLLFTLLAILALLVARTRRGQGIARTHADHIVIAAASVVVHFLLFPVLWDRFFVAQYVLVTIILIAEVVQGSGRWVSEAESHLRRAEPGA